MTNYRLQEGDVILLEEKHNAGAVGKYVVYKTAMEGGGTGHGPNDVYPDGHRVYCESLYNSNARISFYQTGSFMNMIKPGEIMPIAKAKRSWIILEGN